MDEVQFIHLAHIYTKLRDFGGTAAPVASQDGREGEAHQGSPRTTNPRHRKSSDSIQPADEEVIEAVVPKLPEKKLHHLTRHWLTSDEKGAVSMSRLGASSSKEAEHMIRSMGQRELRDGFKKVYGSSTSSYNNNWLRRKLYEGELRVFMWNAIYLSILSLHTIEHLLWRNICRSFKLLCSNRTEWHFK
jgi:hypothetical protein